MRDQASGLRDLMAKSQIRNSKFVTIASGKGGVGKTNFAVNFAYLLANEFHKKILLIDADIGMANAHLFLQLSSQKSLKDLFDGVPIEDVIQRSFNIDVLSGFSGIDDVLALDETAIQTAINQLDKISQNYDYVIIDTGAGIDEKVAAFLRVSDHSIIITTPEPTAMMDAYALIKSIYNIYGYKDLKLVINMVKNQEEAEQTYSKLNMSVKKFLGIDLTFLGYLPFTNALRQAVKKKELVAHSYPRDAFTHHLRKICEEELAVESSKT